MTNGAKKHITKINANPLLDPKKFEFQKLRVAAYCRVSTDNEDQIESYKAQVTYYTDTIAKNPKWKLVHIYADEGITGTATKNRDDFNRMMRDCEKGRIDFILTKSVSRFARNTVDALKYVRKLKKRGIGVYFEEQCLDTLKTENEMALGLYSVMAQSESENISANVRWGIQQRMKTGTYKFRYNILGYKKGEDGEPEIDEKEAKIIREIYDMYLSGKSIDIIKNYLESQHYITKRGSDKWSKSLIKSILSNERYCGDMLLQKTYIEDCISKKSKVNRGELPKYLITNNHPAIISKSEFKAVQQETAKRVGKRRISDKSIKENGKYSAKYALSELLFCGECNGRYRRKTWKKRDGTKEGVWVCLTRIEHGKDCCNSPCLHEKPLQEAICRGLMKIYNDFGGAMDCITASLTSAVTGCNSTIDAYGVEIQIKDIEEQIDVMAVTRERTNGNKERYDNEIKKLMKSREVLKEQLELEKVKIENDVEVNYEIERIKELFENKDSILNYDDDVIRMVVDSIVVMQDKILITVKGGYQIEEQLI